MTSDAGSLLYLGQDNLINNPIFCVTMFTLGFASGKHIEAIKN